MTQDSLTRAIEAEKAERAATKGDKMEQPKHSNVVGGSSAGRVIACPGSRKLAAKMPPGQSSVYAQEGTALHSVMALWFNDKLNAPEDVIGSTLDGIAITREHVRGKIDVALTMFDDLMGDNEAPLYIEDRCDFPDIEGAFGTVDLGTKGVFTIDGKKRHLGVMVDFKFGEGVVVPTANNAQLKFGSLSIARKHPEFFEDCKDGFLTAIIQPGQPCKPHVYTWGELQQFAIELIAAVEAGEKDAPPMATGDHCRWCPAVAICPLKTNLAKSVDVTEKDYLEDIALEDIAEMLGECGELEQYIKAVRAFAYNQANAGADIPGWKLVATTGNRAWLDEAKAERYLAKHLKAGDRRVTKLISPAQAEKALRALDVLDKGAKVPVKLADSKSSGTALVPEDDPRPAALEGAAALQQLGDKLA